MERIRADLHMHGLIGFQPYWVGKQGYDGKNLLKEIADACFSRDVNVCAVTSHETEIPRNSVHDRFNWLKNNFANNLPRDYEFGSIGENIGLVYKDGKKLCLVNGQTVVAEDKGRQVDYLVIGKNDIANGKPLGETIEAIYDNPRLIGGAEHPFCTSHGGIGEDNLDSYLYQISFIEGHNSQLVVPNWMPIFSAYKKGLNDKAQKFAEDNNKPWIASSDAHRIEQAGLSYIETYQPLDQSSDESIMTSLRRIVESGNFEKHCEYSSILDWASWTTKFLAKDLAA